MVIFAYPLARSTGARPSRRLVSVGSLPPRAKGLGYNDLAVQHNDLRSIVTSLPRQKWANRAPQSSQCGPGRRPVAGACDTSDHKVLTLLLCAAPAQDGEQLSAMLLSKFGSLARVIAAPRSQLLLVGGLGSEGATRLKVVHTAALRLLRSEAANGPILSNWRRLTRYLHAVLARESVEQLHILFLDNCYRLLEDETHQHGTVNHVPMYPREVARRALELNASALILAHNHPSGNPTPSPDDIAATKKIRNALATISVELLDHIVIGNGRYVSLREQGFLGGHKRDVVKGKRSGAIAGAAAPHREQMQRSVTTS